MDVVHSGEKQGSESADPGRGERGEPRSWGLMSCKVG